MNKIHQKVGEVRREADGGGNQGLKTEGDVRRWTKPPEGIVKLDVDTAYSSAGAVEVVTRDFIGKMLWMWTNRVSASSAFDAELLGVHLAIYWLNFVTL